MGYPRWTPAQNKMLRELYGTMPNVEIAARMGKSRKAVSTRAKRMGLAKPAPRQENTRRPIPEPVRAELKRTPPIEAQVLLMGKGKKAWKQDELRLYLQALILRAGRAI